MTAADPQSTPHRAIEAIFRIEQAKLIAGLARMTRDVGVAEELAQDALVVALETWPKSGVPEKPGAWLMATAKRRAIDRLRRARMLERKHAEIGRELEEEQDPTPDIEAALDDDIGDDLLRLIFTACHPVLSTEARVALTLRLVGGLTTEEIARAFLVPEPTIAQRIVRAKRTLADKQIPFEVPRGDELAERLASVLEVVYLIFNEGYAATAGEDWLRPQLSEEALRLGRILATLAPEEPEVHGLVALMEIQASRFKARTDADGAPILLLDQNRALWDHLLIGRGLAALARAEDRTRAHGIAPGPYVLQAAVAACHARAAKPEDTDWAGIVAAYDALAASVPSPIVELNRAVAVGMASGPAAGLAAVDRIADDPSLRNYHLLPSVRGEFLRRLDRLDEARGEFERAAALTKNARERALLLARAAECGRSSRGLSPSEERVGEHLRPEQARRGVEEVRHAVELIRDGCASMRRPVDAVHVPSQRPQAGRLYVFHLRKAEVFQQHALPGRIDDRPDRCEPAPSEVGTDPAFVARAGQRLVETFRLDRAHRHALPVDRIEAADTVAEDDHAPREGAQRLVALSLAAGEPVMDDLRQRLGRTDGVMDRGAAQGARKGQQRIEILRRGLVAIAERGQEPSTAFNGNEAGASSSRTAGHEQQAGLRSAGWPPKQTGRVGDSDRERLGLRSGKAQLCHPPWRGTPPARAIDDEIGGDILASPRVAGDACAKTGHGVAIGAKSLDSRAVAHADTRQRADTHGDLMLQQRSGHGQQREFAVVLDAQRTGVMPTELSAGIDDDRALGAKLLHKPGEIAL